VLLLVHVVMKTDTCDFVYTFHSFGLVSDRDMTELLIPVYWYQRTVSTYICE